MTKVTIEKVDGVEQAVANVEINLGEVHGVSKWVEGDNGNKTRAIVAGVMIDSTEAYFKELLKANVEEENLERFEAQLEEYVKLRINQVIGVKKFPLQYGEDGQIEGLAEDVEVEVKADEQE